MIESSLIMSNDRNIVIKGRNGRRKKSGWKPDAS